MFKDLGGLSKSDPFSPQADEAQNDAPVTRAEFDALKAQVTGIAAKVDADDEQDDSEDDSGEEDSESAGDDDIAKVKAASSIAGAATAGKPSAQMKGMARKGMFSPGAMRNKPAMG